MPTYRPDARWLARAVDSVRAQSYPRWELCIADDASPGSVHRDVLASLQPAERRIHLSQRTSRGHISAASNTALDGADGEYVALLDQDDELAPHALARVVEAILGRQEADLVYSDEDKIDTHGRRFDPYFKPDWSPDLALSQNFVSHLGIYRTRSVRDVGGFRQGLEGSQDHDLMLRVMERPGARALHVPDVLYHWRTTGHSTADRPERKGYAVAAGLQAIQSHLERTSREATVESVPPSYYRTRWSLPERRPHVALIASAPRARGGTVDITREEGLEVVLHLVPPPGPTDSRAALLNAAARQCRGEVMVFLGPECALAPGALEELVSQALRTEVGVAGGQIVTPKARVVHGGYLLSFDPEKPVISAHRGLHRDEPGHFGRNRLVQNFSAVSAHAMAIRRGLFEDLSGFDALAFPEALFDVDLCLRIWSSGLRVVWSPAARVAGASSPDAENPPARESRCLVERWGMQIPRDPFWHPVLDRRRGDFRLAP